MSKYVLASMLSAGEGVIANMGGVVGGWAVVGDGLPTWFFVTVGVKTGRLHYYDNVISEHEFPPREARSKYFNVFSRFGKPLTIVSLFLVENY